MNNIAARAEKNVRERLICNGQCLPAVGHLYHVRTDDFVKWWDFHNKKGGTRVCDYPDTGAFLLLFCVP